MKKRGRICLAQLAALLAAVSAACALEPSPASLPHPEAFCSDPNSADLELLRISQNDRKEICDLVARRADYYAVLVARSHEDIYDFPMIEIHMAEVSNRHPTAGPVFFYWKRSAAWSELEEVSRWWTDPVTR